MSHDRRTVLSALGAALPLGLPALARGASAGPGPTLRLRPFEEAVRAAFRAAGPGADGVRVEVGHSEAVRAGLQGCVNDRPFAGEPAGGLRIVRAGTGPGPEVGGVRLYVATVDVVRTDGRAAHPGRPLDFGTLPAAPVVVGSPGVAPEPESGPASADAASPGSTATRGR